MQVASPCRWIAAANVLLTMPASAAQVVASYAGASGFWPRDNMTNAPAVSPATSGNGESSVEALRCSDG